jgi:hypothetical protein
MQSTVNDVATEAGFLLPNTCGYAARSQISVLYVIWALSFLRPTDEGRHLAALDARYKIRLVNKRGI